MQAAQFQTTIDEASFEGVAPVYEKYDSEFQPQPAYIRMDEDGEIDAWVNGNINGTPMSVWHGRTLTWRVPSNVRGDALLAFVKEHQPLFERVYLGHEVDWDGNNHVGKLDEDAQAASEEIEKATKKGEEDLKKAEASKLKKEKDKTAPEISTPSAMLPELKN